jgi:hypothetical protein
MKKTHYIILICLVITFSCNQSGNPVYNVPESPWPESFGNHRAVLKISKIAEAVTLDMLWRRHDPNPKQKRFLIIEGNSGDTIKNIYRYQVDNERCRLVFGPVRKAGTYYFYYLPYEVQEDQGFYGSTIFPLPKGLVSNGKDYLKPEGQPSDNWLKSNKVTDTTGTIVFPEAKVIEIQSRTVFDSFYPMEIIPTKQEKQKFLAKFGDDYLLFTEGRENPIRMKDELPLKWVQSLPSGEFTAKASRNEYFTFQIGIYASKKDIENVKVEFTALEGGKGKIPVTALTCFNTGGIDPYGKPFVKRVDITGGKVQPLWIGIDIPLDIIPGTYQGDIKIKPENAEARSVKVKIKVDNNVLNDRGDSEPWRQSRLRWLNSTAGIDDEVVAPYTPLTLNDKTISCLGRTVRLNEQGLPGMIDSWGNNILSGQLRFVVETGTGILLFKNPVFRIIEQKNGKITWESTSDNVDFKIVCRGNMEFDGHLNFLYTLIPKTQLTVRDIRLELPLRPANSNYMMGMGLPGGYTPKVHTSKWEPPTENSFWIGDPKAGIHCELAGGINQGPLSFAVKPESIENWKNKGKGGFKIERNTHTTLATVFSGERTFKALEPLNFEWNLLITPVKPINYRSQFEDRYYTFSKTVGPPTDEDIRAGVKIVNIGSNTIYNPNINYPFINYRQMREMVDILHAKGMKVKIYNTVRELSNNATELWVLRSLGDEILSNGPGGGYPWLREHLVDNYKPAWYFHFKDMTADAAIKNSPGVNRWFNYYIEGLAWLVKDVGIDGLYLDDVSYDRHIMKRMRKVMKRVKPDCIIDLHSFKGSSQEPAMKNAEFFPYIDKLWFGEGFNYNKMPAENWLIEASGIPFGLMGDMLHTYYNPYGNPWRGMIYGMTVRHPLWQKSTVATCDPRLIWKIWDEFGIESSKMKGYWEMDCPVRTNHPEIYATAYVKEGGTLISIASWCEKPVHVKLHFDWQALGLDSQKAKLIAPEIEGFQEHRTFKPTDFITIEPTKGWLLFLKETNFKN